MKILVQLGVLFALCLASEMISAVLPFSFPGSVISMIVLFFLLTCGAVKPLHLGETTDFLQQNMAFFFIPASVGILPNLPFLADIWLPFLCVCIFSTLITFAATAWTVKAVMALQEKLRRKEAANG